MGKANESKDLAKQYQKAEKLREKRKRWNVPKPQQKEAKS